MTDLLPASDSEEGSAQRQAQNDRENAMKRGWFAAMNGWPSRPPSDEPDCEGWQLGWEDYLKWQGNTHY